MGLTAFFKDMFGNTKKISAENVGKSPEEYIDEEKFEALVAEELMINIAINIIADAISKCEIKTYVKGKEVKGEEYYLWNYEPNKNQNSSEFIHELVYRLLYENRALVFELAGQLVIADGFTEGDEIIRERTFSNIHRGSMSLERSLKMSEVMYFKLNNTSIRNLLANVTAGYNELMATACEKFLKSDGEKGILKIDAQKVSGELKFLGKTMDEVMEDMMNNRFKRFFNSKNAVLPLYNGYEYTGSSGESKKTITELKDVLDIDDKIVTKVANAFNIPVAILKGDVAGIEQVTHNFLTFCIDPKCNMMQGEINRKRSGKEVLKGTGVKIDTTSIMHIDIFNIAEKVDKLISSGTYSIDEIRVKCGDVELGTDYSSEHFITKNYIGINDYLSGKGEENAKNQDDV